MVNCNNIVQGTTLRMAFTRLNKLLVHWRETGRPDAPALIFANSLGTDCRVWDEMAETLGRDWRIVLYDKRGHGLTEAPPGPYNIAMLADDLLALADHLGLLSFAVVGLSIGGLIAQQVAVHAPQRLTALVLADTAAQIGAAESWNARIGAVTQSGVASIADAVMQRWFTPAFHAARPDALAGWRAMLCSMSATGYTAACAALRDADLTGRIGAIAAPTLVVAGEGDQSTPPELVRATASLIPGARFELIPCCGHIPPAEQPDFLAALIQAHLQEYVHV
jgi:3-oxoadipate enol-lactonase